jgi:cell division protein FtsI/penicillin-binding protein 2
MLRRQAISLLLGSVPTPGAGRVSSLDRFLDPSRGCALLLDVGKDSVLAANSSPLAGNILLPPGSTLKPFTLLSLLETGKLRPNASFLCPEKLTLAGRRVDCTHPRMLSPMRVDTALAYSCNCFVAHAAERFGPGELARGLQASGIDHETPGSVTPARDPELQRLQALGEAHVLVTPVGLARAYRQLALRLTGSNRQPGMAEILAGLEGAVEYGTGQLARADWAILAGKTGSIRHGGEFIAWFVGFLPSRTPELVITVMLAGRHGGSDAAPVAGQILAAWHAGRV